MAEEIACEHRLFLDTVADYATAIAGGLIPLEFGLQELDGMARHVDYQAKISIEVDVSGKILTMDVLFLDATPGVSWVQRSNAA